MNGLFSKNNKKFSWVKFSIYALIVFLAGFYIFFGNSFYNNKIHTKDNLNKNYYKGEIVEIGESSQDENTGWTSFKVKVRLISGENKNEIVDADLVQDKLFKELTKEVSVGDKYIVYHQQVENSEYWGLGEPIKSSKLVFLIFAFFIGLIVLGGKTGLTTIASLSATCLGIFMVFVPSVLAGYNTYLNSILVCIFIIITTLPLVIGLNRKCISAVFGCISGVLVSGILALLMTSLMNLSGMTTEESVYITYINSNINLRSIVFASIILGSLGATMDVAISIASSLKELSSKSDVISKKGLFTSGIKIGKDIMGTMTNTLILAYIGSSLSTVLLLTAYNTSLFEVLNKEVITAEILQALAGSIGMLLTIPITALISAVLFNKKRKTL